MTSNEKTYRKWIEDNISRLYEEGVDEDEQIADACMNMFGVSIDSKNGQFIEQISKEIKENMKTEVKEDISFVVVQNKLVPTFRDGYVFTKTQPFIVVGDEFSATKKAERRTKETGKSTAIWKTIYDFELKCITLLQLIKIVHPENH